MPARTLSGNSIEQLFISKLVKRTGIDESHPFDTHVPPDPFRDHVRLDTRTPFDQALLAYLEKRTRLA